MKTEKLQLFGFFVFQTGSLEWPVPFRNRGHDQRTAF